MEEQKILNHADGPDAASMNGMSSLKVVIDVEGKKKLYYCLTKEINECGLAHFHDIFVLFVVVFVLILFLR